MHVIVACASLSAPTGVVDGPGGTGHAVAVVAGVGGVVASLGVAMVLVVAVDDKPGCCPTCFSFFMQMCWEINNLPRRVYLLGGEGGSWSGGARLNALPSNMCICWRTSSMDGWELSVEESEPQCAFTPRLLLPVPVDPPPKPREVIKWSTLVSSNGSASP